MLYRQHFQASVVARHPGLANPEISKIIGRQWRGETQAVKDEWDGLAEKEKQRHHQQYPNYKYQPKRKGKKGSTATEIGSSEDWCVKCGRRNITTPGTPLTPFTPSHGAPTPSSATTRGSISGRQLPPVPRPMSGTPTLPRRPRFPHPAVAVPHYPGQATIFGEEAEAATPLTPNAKRRRFDQYAVPPPLHTGRLPNADDRRVSLPRPDLLPGRMEPPPRPNAGMQEVIDPALTLPPLQTAQSRSVEAMVMTIPYLNKIKVLSKISPPLPPPGPTSPAQQTRGAVIAVEGEDQASVARLTRWLKDEIEAAGRNVVMVMDEAEDEASDERRHGFVGYLNSVAAWHAKSKEMIRFITTAPASTPPAPTRPSEAAGGESTRTPVVLIPGYMLSRSNAAATRIPIDDAYAPVDHWQWAATLWRGIVGPDLTIWLRECGKDELVRGVGAGASAGVEVREDARALVVRRERAGQADDEVEARTLRRLAFEVGEAVRAIAKRDGLVGGSGV
ncbi:MAG: hypothetical protein M1832_001639 [Thelocarpon impressellum]|nr:MAG: hypothetical protein M1832_001639 [Thelocarpon impressellum]